MLVLGLAGAAGESWGLGTPALAACAPEDHCPCLQRCPRETTRLVTTQTRSRKCFLITEPTLSQPEFPLASWTRQSVFDSGVPAGDRAARRQYFCYTLVFLAGSFHAQVCSGIFC